MTWAREMGMRWGCGGRVRRIRGEKVERERWEGEKEGNEERKEESRDEF